MIIAKSKYLFTNNDADVSFILASLPVLLSTEYLMGDKNNENYGLWTYWTLAGERSVMPACVGKPVAVWLDTPILFAEACFLNKWLKHFIWSLHWS